MNPSNLNKNIKMRQNRNSRNNYLNKNQSFAYVHPYIDRYRNSEEKYQHEKYLDKANWLSKKGFVSSVGHYSSKPNFINNYVAMTPSLPPLLHKYRIVDKDKWITKKGFC
ncbi:MAG: hypothetical protein MJ252_00735 [archaeon]|nr:hypothetical protein [archaeon]